MKNKQKYSMGRSIRYMLSLSWKYQKWVIAMMFILAFLQVGLNLAQLYVAPQILQKVESAAPLSELLATIGGFTVLLFVLMALKDYATSNELVGQLYLRTRIIEAINHKAFTTSYPNTTDPKVKKLLEVASDATSNNREASEHIWKTLTSLLTNVLGFGVYLTVLSNVNIVLILITLVTSVASFLCHRYTDKWYYEHREEFGAFWEKFTYINKKAHSVELAKDIRIFGIAGWLRDVYENTLRLMEDFVLHREKAYIKVDLIEWVAGILRNSVSYIFLISMAIKKDLSASEFLLYFTAISTFTQWVTGILNDMSTAKNECRDIGTILEYLNYPEPFRFEGGRPIPESEAYEWKLEDVTFRYPGAEESILRHVNLTIHPGEKLAVVGLNGAGKTTLVKLLCGFYDPDEGRVTLNGIDIREFNRREYYKLLCAVYQEFSIIDASIAQNISQLAEGFDEEKIWHCLKQAGLDEYVSNLPQGLETRVGRDVYLDGVLLSGGQTQRLILARALYKGGPLLVLDEPTAALDPIAENDIYMKYNEMTAGKTSLFISHRLASTRFCDRIIFVADGRIAEEGTHESLLALGGEYAKLYDIQSRYYQEGAEFR